MRKTLESLSPGFALSSKLSGEIVIAKAFGAFTKEAKRRSDAIAKALNDRRFFMAIKMSESRYR
jgi:hypothetical protein